MIYDDYEKTIDSKFNVFFVTDDMKFKTYKTPAIVFSPIEDSWNDFKYKCRYKYIVIFGDDQESIEGQVFLGFLSSDKISANRENIFLESNVIEANDLPPFFTLQGGMDNYRHFVRTYEGKKSEFLLLCLNDLVASKRVTKRSKFIEDAMKTNVFRLAFMRDSERFFAFHNADSILDGVEGENFSGISTNFSLRYEVAGYNKPHKIDLKFDTDSILPKRISILIGRNGLGKSQALYNIVRSLVRGENKFLDQDIGRPMISRLLAIATPGETVNTFPAERANKRIKYRRLILNRGTRSKPSRRFCDLCVQLVRSEEFIGEHYRWDLFKESISFFPKIENIVIPLSGEVTVHAAHIIKLKGSSYVRLLDLDKGGEQANLEILGSLVSNANPLLYLNENIFTLSSGQLTFIKFVIQACLFIENGTLVLLDEPETHLHPNFISSFVRILDRLLKLSGSISIIATHSAYFVREVPRTQVLVFKEGRDCEINIQNPRLKTFGADVGAISYFVFEDEITNALVDDILDQFPEALESRKDLLKELDKELSADVVMYLRRKLNLEIENENY